MTVVFTNAARYTPHAQELTSWTPWVGAIVRPGVVNRLRQWGYGVCYEGCGTR